MKLNKRFLTGAAALCVIAGSSTAASAQGAVTSIRVRGHWIIEVQDPDGRVATHREFDNALHRIWGTEVLESALAGNVSIGAWRIVFSTEGGPPGSPYASPYGTSQGMMGTVPASTTIAEPSLVVQPVELGVDPPLVLSGRTAPAPLAGHITTAGTEVSICEPEIALGQCDAQNTKRSLGFTSTPIAPLRVEPGQVVQVTVSFTFALESRAGFGGYVLPAILSRTASLGPWRLQLEASQDASGNMHSSPWGADAGGNRPGIVNNATVQPTRWDDLNPPLSLSGEINATHIGDVTHVATQVGLCFNGASPATCRTGAGVTMSTVFTRRQIASQRLQVGQTVRTTVTFAFSSMPHPPND